jgi:hypothetical protein
MATQKVVVGKSNISAGQLKDLFRQIEDGSLDGKEIQAFLEHRNPWPRVEKVTLGLYKSGKDYWDALKKDGCYIEACDLHPDRITLAKVRLDVNLVYVTVQELGFTDPAPYSDICNAAQRRGLKLCPAEVGLALRLAVKKQRPDWWPFVAMEPIALEEEVNPDLYIYVLGSDADRDEETDRLLVTEWVNEPHLVDLKRELIFVRPW